MKFSETGKDINSGFTFLWNGWVISYFLTNSKSLRSNPKKSIIQFDYPFAHYSNYVIRFLIGVQIFFEVSICQDNNYV